MPFQVIGVLAAKGPDGSGNDQDDVAFVPISTAKLRLIGGEPGQSELGGLYPGQGHQLRGIESVQSDISGLLRDRHRWALGVPDDFQVSDPAAALAAQQEATRTFSFLLAAIASVSLLVGGISIMNIMLVSVTERTREIGLRLAVGARRRDIRRQFLTEAVALCLVGSALGIVFGVAGAVLLSWLAGWAVFIGPETVVAVVIFAAGMGIFFGIPSVKGGLDPIEALRYE